MTPLEARLERLIAEGRTATYGALAAELGIRINALTAELETLMEADHARDRPLRAALCEGRLNNGLPARGFFAKAAELGCRGVDEPAAFVATHRSRLFSKTRA